MPARRIARPLALVASIIFVLAACGPGTAPQESGSVELQVLNFANYMPPDIAERFEAATGHTMVVTESASNEDAVAKLDASPAGRVRRRVHHELRFAEALNKAGKLEQLDHDQIPNLSNLYPEATELAARSGQRVLDPVLLGHDRHLLSDRSRRRPRSTAGTTCSTPAPSSPVKITMMDEERWLMMPGAQGPGLFDELARTRPSSKPPVTC